MPGKGVVLNIEAERAQVFDGENSRCAGVTLPEGMDLPDAGNKPGNVRNGFADIQIPVVEIPLRLEILIEGLANDTRSGIENRVPPQHPFLLADIVIPDFSGKGIDILEKTAVNVNILNG